MPPGDHLSQLAVLFEHNVVFIDFADKKVACPIPFPYDSAVDNRDPAYVVQEMACSFTTESRIIRAGSMMADGFG